MDFRGRLWFKETVCKKCKNWEYCDKYGTEDLLACIEAEKLRIEERKAIANENLTGLFEDVIKGDDIFHINR